MKLLICLVVVLCVSESLSDPLLLGRRRLGRGCRVGLLGAILGGGDCSTTRIERTSVAAPAPAPAPAASPTVNVNVQNVYSNQDTKQVNNDNRVGEVNNNVVNNKYDLNQRINNKAESNVYNNKRSDNRVVNNNYGGYSEPCEEGC